VATWGVAGYLVAVALSAWGLSAWRLHARWPAGLLLAFGGLATALSIGLALVSKLVIGAWCLLCMGSWAASLGLLVTGWLACRTEGGAAALRADLRAARDQPRLSAALSVAAAVGILLLVATAGNGAAGVKPTGAPAASPGGGELLRALPPATGPAQLFSDYQCPFCAQAHDELREVLRRRPDIAVVRRHFPLDQACNPIMKRPMHLRACAMARAAICAEAQGQLEAMDDALYASQKRPATEEELAAGLGLDLPRFKACLGAPETEARLAADIEAGVKARLRSTPTYVVDGTLHEGKLPVERFPPPGAVPVPAPPLPR
jgi:hypothetical protein